MKSIQDLNTPGDSATCRDAVRAFREAAARFAMEYSLAPDETFDFVIDAKDPEEMAYFASILAGTTEQLQILSYDYDTSENDDLPDDGQNITLDEIISIPQQELFASPRSYDDVSRSPFSVSESGYGTILQSEEETVTEDIDQETLTPSEPPSIAGESLMGLITDEDLDIVSEICREHCTSPTPSSVSAISGISSTVLTEMIHDALDSRDNPNSFREFLESLLGKSSSECEIPEDYTCREDHIERAGNFLQPQTSSPSKTNSSKPSCIPNLTCRKPKGAAIKKLCRLRRYSDSMNILPSKSVGFPSTSVIPVPPPVQNRRIKMAYEDKKKSPIKKKSQKKTSSKKKRGRKKKADKKRKTSQESDEDKVRRICRPCSVVVARCTIIPDDLRTIQNNILEDVVTSNDTEENAIRIGSPDIRSSCIGSFGNNISDIGSPVSDISGMGSPNISSTTVNDRFSPQLPEMGSVFPMTVNSPESTNIPVVDLSTSDEDEEIQAIYESINVYSDPSESPIHATEIPVLDLTEDDDEIKVITEDCQPIRRREKKINVTLPKESAYPKNCIYNFTFSCPATCEDRKYKLKSGGFIADAETNIELKSIVPWTRVPVPDSDEAVEVVELD